MRLSLQYSRTNPLLHEIMSSSRIAIVEDTGYDNWNGGQHGHDVRLYVPLETLAKIDIDEQLEVAGVIATDLRKLCGSIEDEYVNNLVIEMEDENDVHYQRAVPFSSRPVVAPERLSIWKPGLVRVFISHRDKHKRAASGLAEELEDYGFSCFVAHDTIPANEEWRKVIVSGLETMEVMLVFLTDDFHESTFTMQEVGYALGRGIPYVSLKLESRDPPGFISQTQALRGHLADPTASAKNLSRLLAEAIGRPERLQSALVTAFCEAPNWSEAGSRFDRMKGVVTRLSDAEFAAIVEAYAKNDQLHNATYLTTKDHRRLKEFLVKATGTHVEVFGKRITSTKSAGEDIPF